MLREPGDTCPRCPSGQGRIELSLFRTLPRTFPLDDQAPSPLA
jgi:hypothetical protein